MSPWVAAGQTLELVEVLSFGGLRSVKCSSGVKAWRLLFKVWAATWTIPSALFCVSCR